MRRTIVAAVSMLLVHAAIAVAPAAAAEDVPPDTRIVLERGACEHRCAVYSLGIAADGSVVWDGRFYVAHAGRAKAQVPAESVRALLEEARAIGFFELPDSYGVAEDSVCDDKLSDAPMATVTITADGAAKSVAHWHGCVTALGDRLTAFEDAIDAAAGSVRWIK